MWNSLTPLPVIVLGRSIWTCSDQWHKKKGLLGLLGKSLLSLKKKKMIKRKPFFITFQVSCLEWCYTDLSQPSCNERRHPWIHYREDRADESREDPSPWQHHWVALLIMNHLVLHFWLNIQRKSSLYYEMNVLSLAAIKAFLTDRLESNRKKKWNAEKYYLSS